MVAQYSRVVTVDLREDAEVLTVGVDGNPLNRAPSRRSAVNEWRIILFLDVGETHTFIGFTDGSSATVDNHDPQKWTVRN